MIAERSNSNMARPRTPSSRWHLNNSMIFTVAIIGGIGIVYMVFGRPYLKGNPPYGDATKLHKRAGRGPRNTPLTFNTNDRNWMIE